METSKSTFIKFQCMKLYRPFCARDLAGSLSDLSNSLSYFAKIRIRELKSSKEFRFKIDLGKKNHFNLYTRTGEDKIAIQNFLEFGCTIFIETVPLFFF